MASLSARKIAEADSRLSLGKLWAKVVNLIAAIIAGN